MPQAISSYYTGNGTAATRLSALLGNSRVVERAYRSPVSSETRFLGTSARQFSALRGWEMRAIERPYFSTPYKEISIDPTQVGPTKITSILAITVPLDTEFSYAITADNVPTQFYISPSSEFFVLNSFDEHTGILHGFVPGWVTSTGIYQIGLVAGNKWGAAEATLQVSVVSNPDTVGLSYIVDSSGNVLVNSAGHALFTPHTGS